MNTQGKIDLALDPARLCLHKEGIFHKLYNQDAMRFTDNIRPLKITGRFVKTVNEYVYSAGFPASLLDAVTKQLVAYGGVLADADGLITVSGVVWEKENDYGQWRENQTTTAAAAGKNTCAPPLTLAQEIAAFPVMHRTPMEAMNFIIELQERLHTANE